ncbi:sulfite exporter TauE/SafE family protein [Clostridium aestuarii]|uniref:Probable membrane transporter protein n=1 Tax=Clostridium aestuarii TaxID=338193 RepID=A0ABT4CV81_9CLOT|nr:sulfite exporter TauE/SafE family protein [Clostridium aestuarii]MCY6482897.1 sulfite exporter TauE/SafE family protein [Clostridium aestuarii]
MKLLMVLAAGVVAGFINTLAGGGSLLTMPLLIFLGLPSVVANGTNRVALMVQNIVAVTNFKKKGYFDIKFSLMLGIPAIIGSIVGAKIAIKLPDEVFNKILGVIMIIVVIFIIWQPQKRIASMKKELTKKHKALASIVFFFVGIYGGLVQAGTGFIVIISLTLITGFSLVKINSLKVFVIAMYMVSALLVFIVNGKVDWLLGLTLAVGNGLGGYIGSNFAVKKGDKYIRIVLFVAVLLMAGKLLGIYK